MCGIVGLFSKSAALEERLGEHLADMLVQLSERGPDSAGVAVYRNPVSTGSCKLTLFSPDEQVDWRLLGVELESEFGGDAVPEVRASHAIFVLDIDADTARAWLRE